MPRLPHLMGYSRAQIRLHWLVAVLITLQYLLHEPIVAAWRAFRKGETLAFQPLVALHVAGGLAILALVLWRSWLRYRRGAPPPPEAEPAPCASPPGRPTSRSTRSWSRCRFQAPRHGSAGSGRPPPCTAGSASCCSR
ncbi:MAG: hypothetical protein R3D25_00455 [Geminicoccaceae bacterium]